MTDETFKTLEELRGIVNNFVIRGSGVAGNLKTGWTVNPGSGQISSGSGGGVTPETCYGFATTHYGFGFSSPCGDPSCPQPSTLGPFSEERFAEAQFDTVSNGITINGSVITPSSISGGFANYDPVYFLVPIGAVINIVITCDGSTGLCGWSSSTFVKFFIPIAPVPGCTTRSELEALVNFVLP